LWRFRSDNCFASAIHDSWRAAERAAATLKRRYRPARPGDVFRMDADGLADLHLKVIPGFVPGGAA
jgi:hypothetical protein